MLNTERHTGQLAVAGLWLVLLLLSACGEEAKEHTARAIFPSDSVSMMTTYGVNTLISDSGVIKYRIVTERWDVNVIRQPNRWEFMKGVFFEQFDEQFHVQGYIQADTAWYYDQMKLWKLRGRVRVRNNNGLIYTSEELYWDGMKHELYSYVFSQVTTPERTLQGTYFAFLPFLLIFLLLFLNLIFLLLDHLNQIFLLLYLFHLKILMNLYLFLFALPQIY